MSDIAPRPNNKPAQSGPGNQALLKQLPRDWRKPVGFFWAMNAHLLKDEMVLVTRLKSYAARGLTLDDLLVIFRGLTDPEKQANHEFPGRLMKDLASAVATTLRRKRIIEEQLERRRLSAGHQTPSDEIRSKLRDMFKPDGTGEG